MTKEDAKEKLHELTEYIRLNDSGVCRHQIAYPFYWLEEKVEKLLDQIDELPEWVVVLFHGCWHLYSRKTHLFSTEIYANEPETQVAADCMNKEAK